MDNKIDESILEELNEEVTSQATVEIPMIALRGMVVYPHGYMNFDRFRKRIWSFKKAWWFIYLTRFNLWL